MSSNWSRKNYDECSYKQKLDMSIEAGMYHSFLPRYENELGINSTNLPCNLDSMKNTECNNQNAKYNNDFKAKTNELLDIESDLKNYNRLNSNCNTVNTNNECLNNFKSCSIENYVVTPNLNSRILFPSNMKMPKNNGLKY